MLQHWLHGDHGFQCSSAQDPVFIGPDRELIESWDNYTTDAKQRAEIYASPLRASTDQLKGLPPALIQTAGADVLRDEGEAYARKLDAAGVPVTAVRYNGMIHDYGLLNVVSQVPAVRSALLQASDELKQHLK
ncbi:alpha/beta hydrolase fold domain-containing protein [Pseudomonas reactans]|uniref:alpha/beta hydrolase fold domain-containing protein n=1 Tax=Pseudomonas reactans TaxID=117680 RepID=UPI003F74D98E